MQRLRTAHHPRVQARYQFSRSGQHLHPGPTGSATRLLPRDTRLPTASSSAQWTPRWSQGRFFASGHPGHFTCLNHRQLAGNGETKMDFPPIVSQRPGRFKRWQDFAPVASHEIYSRPRNSPSPTAHQVTTSFSEEAPAPEQLAAAAKRRSA
jgi:hypothetical protein